MSENFLWRLARRCRRRLRLLLHPSERLTGVAYWEARVSAYGERAVFNTAHDAESLNRVTEMQRQLLFPALRDQLDGTERRVADFGCGTGRFTSGLASLIGGTAVGLEPISALLRLAPAAPNVEYRQMQPGSIPLEASSVDVLWVCLVMGGITDETDLRRTLREMDRVLKPGGLVFLVENTNDSDDTPQWAFRSVETYRRLFAFSRLSHLFDYEDLGETISVLAGRK